MKDAAASRLMSEGDEPAVLATIAVAFAEDPGARWFSPTARAFLENIVAHARVQIHGAMQRGSAYCTDDCTGVALWLPPGGTLNDEALEEALSQAVPDAIAGDIAVLEEQAARYRPEEPHWYLPILAVDPAYQGRGHGGALLRQGLEACDRDGAPAYLEASNPRCVRLYERHGFQSLGTIQAGSSPAIVPMLRPAVGP
ncbi:MAG: GNAT family N-acetyltransferase [Acidobacteriota bacterium]